MTNRHFAPHVQLAHFLCERTAAGPLGPHGLVDLLKEIDRNWPDLSFRDFIRATALAEALAMRTEGSA